MSRNTLLSANMRWKNSRSILNGGEPPWRKGREQISDLAIEPVFFRIDIESMTGLGAVPEAE